MTVGLVLGLTTAVGLLAVYLWMAGGEIQENRYDNYSEARPSMNRGWLPAGLPRSATQVHEWHNLDTNARFGSFRFDPGEVFEATLQPGVRSPIRIDRDPSFAITLVLDPTETQLRDAGFRFYADQDLGFAINQSAGIAYFWGSSP